MRAQLRSELEQRLGCRVRDVRAVGGGDINEAYRVALDDGRALFVKTHPRPLPRMFECEARGLGWLAKARALRTPEVVAFADGQQGGAAFLALELIEPGARAHDYDERLGRGLA